jgi:hypothetical protein
MAATRRAAAPLPSIYRFHYHRQREAIAAAQIQFAESPENLGRFTPQSFPWLGLATRFGVSEQWLALT